MLESILLALLLLRYVVAVAATAWSSPLPRRRFMYVYSTAATFFTVGFFFFFTVGFSSPWASLHRGPLLRREHLRRREEVHERGMRLSSRDRVWRRRLLTARDASLLIGL